MRSVFQRRLVEGESRGDCFRACLASLFEVRYEQVPAFEDMERGEWAIPFCEFVMSVGYEYFGTVPLDEATEDDSVDGLFLAYGGSPRHAGRQHAVIMTTDGLIAHDPHPAGGGVLDPIGVFSLRPIYELTEASPPEHRDDMTATIAPPRQSKGIKDPWLSAASLSTSLLNTLLGEMASRGIDKAELAKRCKKTEEWVERFFGGRVTLTLEAIASVSIAIGLKPDVLLVEPGSKVSVEDPKAMSWDGPVDPVWYESARSKGEE